MLAGVPAALLAAAASAQHVVERASVTSAGGQADSGSQMPSLSSNGRWVAFESGASNLVPGDTNSKSDIFVRDRASGTTQRVSVSSSGTQANGVSLSARISGDGRFVYFCSYATNLVPGDNNGWVDVFEHELATGITTRVSVTSSGAEGTCYSLLGSSSSDGARLAFSSAAVDLVAGDTNAVDDIFVRERAAGTTTRISVGPGGAQANGNSESPWISLDGKFVAFAGVATNLVANDLSSVKDVFVRDLTTGTTERVSLDSQGTAANNDCVRPVISGDGRFVAFESGATNLVGGDANGYIDVFVRDRAAGTTARVSVDSLGSEGNLASAYPSISGDGRWVLFESWANNLVANDTNGTLDVFGFDQLTSTTVRLSQATAGAQGNGASRMPAASAAGDVVAFWSFASSLVSGDTNLSPDVFVDASLAAAPMSFCTAGTTSNGCVPQISANAQPQASGAGSCQILVQSVEGQRSGIVFYGIDNSGYAAPAWGAGTSYLCVKPPTQRTAVQSSGGSFNACDGSLQLDWNAFQLAHPSALGAPWSVGASAYVQAWFRDPPAPKSTNLSDALHLQYLP